MTLTLSDTTLSSPTPARTRVAALVVTGDGDDGVNAALDALAAQTVTPERVVLVDRRQSDPGRPPVDLQPLARIRLPDSEVLVHRTGPVPVRTAVHATVLDLDDPTGWLVWVLGSGVTPSATALAELLGAHRRSPSVGVVGPKLVQATDPHRLRSVGISATRSGRIVPDPPDGMADQGQFDRRADVLAVPVTGALIEAALIRDLRGWERTFGDVGADLDFGWRAQRLGRRVLVHPQTTVRVADGLGDATATTGARRRAGRRVALTRASWWGAPLLAVWLLVSSIAGAAGLLLAKRPRSAWTTLADVFALDPFRVVPAWLRTRGAAPVRRRDLQGLFVSAAQVRARLADQVHQAVVPGRGTVEDGPPELSRSSALKALTNPGLLATVVVAAVFAAAGRTLGVPFLAGLGGGPVGGELLGGRLTSSALWHAATDPWRGAGLGSATELIGGPHLAVLALPTWVVEHLPGLAGLTSPGGLVVGLLLVAGPVLATISAYAAGRVITLARWPRAAAALAWATVGPMAQVYGEGRVGAVVAHVLLPAVTAGLVLLARPRGTATAAWATALAAALLGAFAPVALLLVMAVALLLVLAAPTAAARLRAVVPLVVPGVLLGPWTATVWSHPQLALAGPGLTSRVDETLEPWQLGLLQLAPDPQVWSIATVGAIAVLAVLGWARGTGVRSVATGAAATALIALGAVLIAPRVALTSAGEGVDSVRPWVGLPMMFLLIALLGGALLVWQHPEGATRSSRAVRSGATAVLGLAGVLAGGLLVATGLGVGLLAWQDPRPAVAVEHAQGDVSGRTLFLLPGGDGVGYRLVSREITDVARSLPVDRSDDAVLAPTVSALLDDGEGAAALQQFAIGVVALTEDADPGLTRALDSADGMTRLVARDGWNYWRVTASGAENTRPVAPPRLQLSDGTGHSTVLVPTTGIHAATTTTLTVTGDDTRLTVAEGQGWSAHAQVTWLGQVVAPEPGERAVYRLTPGEGTLDISLIDPHHGWRLLQFALLGIVLFLAIPFGSRASRSRS